MTACHPQFMTKLRLPIFAAKITMLEKNGGIGSSYLRVIKVGMHFIGKAN